MGVGGKHSGRAVVEPKFELTAEVKSPRILVFVFFPAAQVTVASTKRCLTEYRGYGLLWPNQPKLLLTFFLKTECDHQIGVSAPGPALLYVRYGTGSVVSPYRTGGLLIPVGPQKDRPPKVLLLMMMSHAEPVIKDYQ